jgi:hypothetical protein
MTAIQSRLGTWRQGRAENLVARVAQGIATFVRRYRAAVELADRLEPRRRVSIDDLRRAGLL